MTLSSATPVPPAVPLWVDAAAIVLDDVPGRHRVPAEEDDATWPPLWTAPPLEGVLAVPDAEEPTVTPVVETWVVGGAADVDDIEAVDMTSTRVTSAEVRPEEEEDVDSSITTLSLCTWSGTDES